jgi:hypothetical protein
MSRLLMFRSLLRTVALRIVLVFVLVFVLVQGGALVAAFGLASMPRTPETTAAWNLLAVGLGTLYGAFLISALFLVLPLMKLARRIRQFLSWKDWVLRELPQIIAALTTLLPPLIAAVKAALKGDGGDQGTPSAETKPEHP